MTESTAAQAGAAAHEPAMTGTKVAMTGTASPAAPRAVVRVSESLNAPDSHRRPRSSRPRRFWSARRLPTVLVTVVILVASGALLYDVAAVRADRPAQTWRRRVADELATRSLDSPWLIGAGAVAVVVGLWLIWLAATPGLRSVLPMRPTQSAELRAGLDRAAAAQVLRDRALQVAGVAGARVKVRRRGIKARADVHFRDLAEVRDELDGVLDEGVNQLGLAAPPPLALTVRPVKRR